MKKLFSAFTIMSKVSISISCFTLIFVTSVAMATPATTQQTWTFDDADNPAIPEWFINVYGTPVAELSTAGDPDYFGWLNFISGRQGVWAGEPLEIELIIPNNPILNAYKEISLEMDFMQVLDWIQFPHPVGGSVVETSRTVESLPDGWSRLNISWQISPNPEGERIIISVSGNGGFADYISVETACVPEPATICLLGLGGLALLRKRR